MKKSQEFDPKFDKYVKDPKKQVFDCINNYFIDKINENQEKSKKNKIQSLDNCLNKFESSVK